MMLFFGRNFCVNGDAIDDKYEIDSIEIWNYSVTRVLRFLHYVLIGKWFSILSEGDIQKRFLHPNHQWHVFTL